MRWFDGTKAWLTGAKTEESCPVVATSEGLLGKAHRLHAEEVERKRLKAIAHFRSMLEYEGIDIPKNTDLSNFCVQVDGYTFVWLVNSDSPNGMLYIKKLCSKCNKPCLKFVDDLYKVMTNEVVCNACKYSILYDEYRNRLDGTIDSTLINN